MVGMRATINNDTVGPVSRRNVVAILLFQFLLGIADTIAVGSIFDAFLFLISGSKNQFVGYVESVNGITSFVVAIPVGFAVDRYSRTALVRLGAAFMLVSAFSLAIVVWRRTTDWQLWVTMVIAGIGRELTTSASEAIFADSLKPGRRTKIYTWKAQLNTLASAAGPCVALACFLIMGDSWRLTEVRLVLILGSLVYLPTLVILFVVRDPVRSGEVERDDGQEATDEAERDQVKKCCGLRQSSVPYLMTVSSFVVALGAGMTIRFFALYFKTSYSFLPIHLCMLDIGTMLSITVFMHVALMLSKCLGRAQAALLCFSFNVAAFVALSQVHLLAVVIPIYLIRCGLANGTYPIDQSILQDFIPTRSRGKWNAVNSLFGMTWSGSAVLGGYLADKKGYSYTFLITAGFYSVGCLLYSPLLCLVPRQGQQKPLLEASVGGISLDSHMADGSEIDST